MSPPYAYTQRHDPTSGEPILVGNQRAESTAPQTERALMTLRTTRGLCLADPTFGVEWGRVDKLGTGAAATARAVISEALAYMVSDGSIASLTVECEVDVGRGMLLYEVTFTDPRLDRRARIRGEV